MNHRFDASRTAHVAAPSTLAAIDESELDAVVGGASGDDDWEPGGNSGSWLCGTGTIREGDGPTTDIFVCTLQ